MGNKRQVGVSSVYDGPCRGGGLVGYQSLEKDLESSSAA